MDEFKLRLDEARARKAEALLKDDLLAEAFTSLEAAYIGAWRATHVLDDKGREKLFIAVNVIGKVKDHLNRVLADGKLAQADLAELAKQSQPRKRA